MPRPIRLEYKNAFYHLMNLERGRQTIFPAEQFYQIFQKTLQEVHDRFGLEIHAFCLMSNHYHLLVKTPNVNLSCCMRHINGLFTQRHNRLKRIDGPLFRGRYRAILVDKDNYFLRVTRYIHRNPKFLSWKKYSTIKRLN
jgi:putative transposase